MSTLFLRNRHLLAMTMVLLLAAALSAALGLPRIEDPRITNRNAVVLTLFPGASAARVEAQVTKKLETRLQEVAAIRDIESSSRAGVSLIKIELEDAIDSDSNEAAFSRIRDKLADAGRELPPAASAPEFDDKRGAVAFGIIAAVQWQGGDQNGQGHSAPPLGLLGRRAEELADRLREVPGTELVRRYGEPQEEFVVTVDGAELAALGMAAADLAGRLSAADAKGQAGVLRAPGRDLLLEVGGELDSAARIGMVPLLRDARGAVVELADVATVSRGWRSPARELAFADGRPAVLVAARAGAGVDMAQWSTAARQVMRELADEHRGDAVGLSLVFDQSRYTSARLRSLSGNLLAGAGVVMLVVWLAMGWRAALIVGSALPLSAGAALFGLGLFGQQIHQMSIFGLIIAIGLLIDNAIVVTDEIRRRRRAGHGPGQAMSGAIAQLRAPLFASTLTTILGFMPVFLLPGNVGDFVSPIAISVVLALAASFLISMTVIAALAAGHGEVDRSALPRSAPAHRWWRDGVDGAGLARAARPLLVAAVTHPIAALGLGALLPAAGLLLAGTLGNQFFPPAERDQFEVELWLPSAAAIDDTAAVVRRAERLMRGVAGVERVDWLVGGSFPSVYYNRIMDQDDDSRYAHGIVQAASVEVAGALIPRLQERLDAGLPEARVVVSAFGQGPPIDAPIALRIVGPEPQRLRAYGEQLRAVLATLPGVLHSQASIAGGEPKLWFRADEAQSALAGFDLRGIADQMQFNLEGAVGGSVLEDIEQLPVRIRYAQRQRVDPYQVASMPLVPAAAGVASTPASAPASAPGAATWVPAAALGELELVPEPAALTRRNGERVNHVYAWLQAGVLPMDVARRVPAQLAAAGFELAPGYRLEVGGDSEAQGRATASLAQWLPVLAVLMVAALVLSFRSATLAALIGVVALLSVGLGLFSLWLGGWPIGFNPIIGSAGLVGVAINGSIVVLAAIRADPAARRGEADAIVRCSRDASRHILATTLTTSGGFLPLLLSGGAFWPPLAVVIAGGVGLSVTLSLWFTPAAYALLSRQRRRAREHRSRRFFSTPGHRRGTASAEL